MAISTGIAQEFANIEYLCADWGPAMTWSGKTNEPPQFSDTEDEVYFLKQVGSFTKGLLETQNRGLSIYLCKMKADGSGKMEIKELWKNPNYPIDTQGYSTWMEVNRKTRKIALSVLFAGSDVTGLWTVNFDGTELKQIIRPEWGEKLTGIDHPSWTPDGQRIVFAEIMRGTHPRLSNIAMCDSNGGQVKRLLVGTNEVTYAQPSISPDGNQIVYVHNFKGASWVSLMNIDGSNAHQIPNPSDKRNTHGGTYPVWSPDGSRVLYAGITGTMIDATTGKNLFLGQPLCEGKRYTFGWPHWGKGGIIGYTISGILVTDTELTQAKLIGGSRLAECHNGLDKECRW
ncbi:MAG: hypothetical protein ABSH21_07145 [Verrucomicrobiia bacterium]